MDPSRRYQPTRSEPTQPNLYERSCGCRFCIRPDANIVHGSRHSVTQARQTVRHTRCQSLTPSRQPHVCIERSSDKGTTPTSRGSPRPAESLTYRDARERRRNKKGTNVGRDRVRPYPHLPPKQARGENRNTQLVRPGMIDAMTFRFCICPDANIACTW